MYIPHVGTGGGEHVRRGFVRSAGPGNFHGLRFLAVLLAACIALPLPAQRAFATADDEYLAGLTYLEDTTNIDIAQALSRFHAALSLDPAHGAANVFAAVLEFAQIADDGGLKTMRLALSDGRDSATSSYYISHVLGRDEDFDSMTNYRHYVFGSSDPKASDVQAVMNRILTDSFPHMEAHLVAAENTIFDLPGKLMDEARRPDTVEIDKTEILALHSGLLAVKAVLVILTSYDLDVDIDPENVPDTIDWKDFKDTHPDLLTANGNWDTAWAAIREIDTKIYDARAYLASESDSQDSDLIRRITDGLDTTNSRYINDTDFNRALDWHSDTVAKVFRGDSITFDSAGAQPELGRFAVVPSALFSSPPDRADLNDLESVRGRGLEWNDAAPIDPTLGGILPGMTMNKMFIWATDPDTYFVVDQAQTIDLNDVTQFGFWNATNRPHKVIDLRFTSAAPVTVLRRNTSAGGDLWRVDITPNNTGHHVRLFFKEDARDFFPWETFKIRRPGDFAGPAMRVVPWMFSGDDAVDAGSDASTFSSYFSSFTVSNAWLKYAADTLAMFVLPNAQPQFDTIPTSTIKSPSNDTTLVIGSLTGTDARLGWFLTGAPASGSDSILLFSLYNAISGDASQALDRDFAVAVYKIRTFADTQFGFFTDYDYLPIAGVPVTFSIHDAPNGASGQDLDTTSTATNDSGLAYTRLTLGNVGGAYTVKAALSADSGGADVLMFGITEGVKPWAGGEWGLFSLPRQPPDLTTSGIMAGGTVSSGNWRFYEYDPATDAFSQPSSLAMGRGYWLKTLVDGLIVIDPATSTELTDTQYVSLTPGWNQIGIPFEEVYTSKNLLVRVGGTIVSIDTAADSGIVDNAFYTYGGSSVGYSVCDGSVTTCYFYPFEGQWMYASAACDLVFPPPSTSASTPATSGSARLSSASYRSPNHPEQYAPKFYAASPPMAAKNYDEWTVQLMAESGKYRDLANIVGVRAAPPRTLRKAPRAPLGVHLSINKSGGKYATAYCLPDEKPSWDIEVYSAQPGSVTVRAANLSSVPEDLPLTLTDLSTHAQVNLRENPSYTYASGVAESRSFNISTDKPSLLNKVVHPAACVIASVFGPASRTIEMFRTLRDICLNTSLGRRLTRIYYGWTI